MIGSIRQQMQKSGAKIILWLTLFAVAGSSFIYLFTFSRKFKENTVAMVNDESISYQEFRRKYAEAQQFMQHVRKMYGKDADMILKLYGFDKKPQDVVIEGLISEKAVQSAANGLGTQVSNEYLQEKIRDPLFSREHLANLLPPELYIGGTIDLTSLNYYLQRQGISESEFEESLADTMQRYLFEKLVEGGLYIPRSVIQNAFERQYLKKKYVLLTLSFADYLKEARKEKLSDDAITKFYDSHKEQYRIPEKRAARVWTFDPETYGVAISVKDLESEYHKRKKTYIEKPEEMELQRILITFTDKNKVEMRAKAQELLKKVKDKPESFGTIAQEYSRVKDKGAKITVKRGEKMDPYFEQTAFNLKVNEISPVMETSEGFEIIKLLSKKEPVYKPFDKVKETLAKELKSEKFTKDFNVNAQRVINQESDIPGSIAKFVSEHKGQESKLENVTADSTLKNSKLFGLSKVGDRVFFLDQGKGMIMELTNITPSVLPPVNTVREKVIQDIYNDKAHYALEVDVNNTVANIGAGKETIQQASKNLKGSIETTDWIDWNNPASYKKLQDKEVPVQAMAMLTRPHAVTSELTKTNGYIIEVAEVEPFNEKAFNERKDSLAQQLRRQESNALVQSFMQSLRDKAHVEVREEFLRQAAR